ncbi:MAG: hypothetical protein IIV64_05120, partial [Muribaculaceae bacterium]|nr:hypothetical protein [Muribaculaceae bacterium]
MMSSIRRNIWRFMTLLMVACMAVACSTTRRIDPGEQLYTGVDYIHVNPTDGEKLNSEMVANIKEAVNVAPNNPMPFMSPYVRTPLPIGLWVYNNWSDTARGLSGWIYDKLVA